MEKCHGKRLDLPAKSGHFVKRQIPVRCTVSRKVLGGWFTRFFLSGICCILRPFVKLRNFDSKSNCKIDGSLIEVEDIT